MKDVTFTAHASDGVAVRLTDAAFRVYHLAFCWCARNESDGRIPKDVAKNEWPNKRAIDELLSKGAWRDVGSDYEAVDFLATNPEKSELVAKRTATKVRVKKSRHRIATGNGVTDAATYHASSGVANHVTDAASTVQSLPSHTLPSPPPPLGSGSSLISGSSEPSSDLTGSPRDVLSAGLLERLVQPAFAQGEAPPPRKDPLFAKVRFARWFPSAAMLAWCKQVGLTDRDVDATLAEARDGLTGQHDFEWFDVKIWRYLDVAVQRKANPGGTRAGRVQANAEWPTEDAARLREAIRSGQHGKGLATKLDAGQLDYPLAQRLVRERQEAAGRRPDGQVGVPPPGDLSALLRGTTRAMP